MQHNHHHSNHSKKGLLATSAHATAHCLVGCSIGEFTGVSIGVALGLANRASLVLGIALSFVCGYALAILPLLKKLSFWKALKALWLGELLSITTMEIVETFVEFHLGLKQTNSSFTHPLYWIAMGVAAVAGFIITWPVNYLLIKKQVKQH